MAGVFQLIYSSRPFGFDDARLNSILIEARRNDDRDAITGALVCRQDVYLQLLEGPQAAVEHAFARIVADDRHSDVVKHHAVPAAERIFPAWAMRDDPARSWMWSPDEVAAGAICKASAADLLAVFERLAAEPA